MKLYIALFRGINVGGNSILPMAELRAILSDLGAQDVQTYIQSGNAVFRHEENSIVDLADRLMEQLHDRKGFSPKVLLLSSEELESAISENPFPVQEEDASTLHLGFLVAFPQNPNMQKLEQLRTKNERFRLSKKVFYLHAPDGVGKSRLAAAVEGILGVEMTDRNWRTVLKLKEMCDQLSFK